MKLGLDAFFYFFSDDMAGRMDLDFCFSSEGDGKLPYNTSYTIILLFEMYQTYLSCTLKNAVIRDDFYSLDKDYKRDVISIHYNFNIFLIDDTGSLNIKDHILAFSDRMLDKIAPIDSYHKLMNFCREIPFSSNEAYDEFSKDIADPVRPYLKNASEKLYELKRVIHSEGGYRYSEKCI